MTVSYVRVDGGRIAIQTRGQGPLVVCSPAMGDTRDAFDPLADRLVGAGYQVVLVDLRGHGESDVGFQRYGDEATASDLIAVIEAVGAGPAYLMGASMSAAAATIAAAERPELVAGLVLLAPFLRDGVGPVMRCAMRLALLRPWGPAVWAAYSARLWPGLGEAGRARAQGSKASLTRPGRWGAFSATANAGHRVVEPFLGKTRAPALIVVGENDPDWKDPVAEASWVAAQVRGEVFAVPGVGHAPMLEAPDPVAERVLDFFKEVARAASRA